MKCLVTKLKGSVSDSSILKLGELRISQSVIESPSKNTQYINVVSTGDIKSKVENGYFTDQNLSQNLGQEVVNNNTAHLTISNSDCVISLFDKYNITELRCKNPSANVDARSLNFCKELTVLEAGINGDISNLKDCPIKSIEVKNKEAYGDVAVLANKLNGESANAVIASPNIVGDIAVFNNKNISTLNISGSGISGTIDGLNLPATTWLKLSSSISGKIEKFKSSKCNLVLKESLVTGDISKTTGIAKLYGPKSLNWGDGTPSNFINLDMIVLPTIEELDRMLIKEAELVANASGSDLLINVGCTEGNRTTASDSAVSTLKSKGVSITINDTTL